MTLKSDVKFQKKQICYFKTGKNLVNFDPSTRKSQKICTLMGFFCAKYIMFDLKNYRGVIEKLTCGLENDMKNLVNLQQST